MPRPPRNDGFSADDLALVYSVADTILPAVTTEELVRHVPRLEEADRAALEAFATQVPSATPAFRRELTELIPASIPPHKWSDLKKLLWLMNTRAGRVLFTGGLTPYQDLAPAERERLLLAWKGSRLAPLRSAYDVLIKLCMMLYMRSSPEAHAAMGYAPVLRAAAADSQYPYEFLTASDLRIAQSKGPAWDVVIIGSGSGGGVAAKYLAEAGMRVLVVEKGHHQTLYEHGLTEAQALNTMYDGEGFPTTEDHSVAVLSGSVWGGGTTVNWAASLQTPAAIRAEWAALGLPYFTSPSFQEDLDVVSDVMGVSPPTSQSAANQVLLEGARRLGYAAAPVPQNNGNGVHDCGHECANGCTSGGKKGTTRTWLVDAAKAGAKFVTGAAARRILFDHDDAAKAVFLRFDDGKEVRVKTQRVLLCGGGIQSPAVLLRSRIANGRVGKGLHLHPTNYVHARMPAATNPTEGNILTSVVTENAFLPRTKANAYGVRIETGVMQPGVGMSLMQWHGGAEHKARLATFNRMVGMVVITRDAHWGRVALDSYGEPTIVYSVSPEDAASVVKGTLTAAECLRVMGAEEISVAARGLQPWAAPAAEAGASAEETAAAEGAAWRAWTEQVKTTAPSCFGSAHQMASCRMAATKGKGTCDAAGAVYGVSGVWCADASVLPGASGVNPMLTTMAVARMVSRGVVREWRKAQAKL